LRRNFLGVILYILFVFFFLFCDVVDLNSNKK
jgi:hypothetical protein